MQHPILMIGYIHPHFQIEKKNTNLKIAIEPIKIGKTERIGKKLQRFI